MVLPPAMLQRAREFTGPPATARPAATVVLLRPSGSAFQVYVLRRVTTMVFGGVYAFPGGVVDPTDQPATIRTDWAARLGVPEDQAHAVVGAAARELFEETGVLLAGPHTEPDRTVAGLTASAAPTDLADSAHAAGSGAAGSGAAGSGAAGSAGSGAAGSGAAGSAGSVDSAWHAGWEADRAAVQGRELSMTDLLERRGLRLRDDLLLPWSRWITPEFEPKRFDTWFFAALLPEAQHTQDVSGEADRTAWIDPGDADDLPMLPPTRHTLRQLAACGTIEEVVAAAAHRDAGTPVQPRIDVNPDGQVTFQIPG
ncbi:NUDIX hydrolase [Actinoplanes sp. DH11]|uniref:NUDIX hydrolase n=1 Tax=Actinoplanes sp. DH11 TaxID=2857011 RepID=UPI001E5597B3|nr:NUDIX hydrolase [Actinoplanes sp. DH11]